MSKFAHDYTHWHKFAETVEKTRKVLNHSSLKNMHQHERRGVALYDIIKDVPKFTIEKPFDDFFKNQEDDINSTISLLSENNLIHLPFKEIILEHVEQDKNNKSRAFTYIKEIEENIFEIAPFLSNEQAFLGLYVEPYLIKVTNDAQQPVTMNKTFAQMVRGSVFENTELRNLKTKSYEQYISSTTELDLFVFKSFIVSLATKGMAREVIKPSELLNIAKSRNNKPTVPEIILIKIDHYYDRSGKRHDHDRNSPRLHWRRGHMRTVWVGQRGSQTAEQRYIFPCLVNYSEGDDIPAHKTRIIQ